jgi:hypothetical protein
LRGQEARERIDPHVIKYDSNQYPPLVSSDFTPLLELESAAPSASTSSATYENFFKLRTNPEGDPDCAGLASADQLW